MFKLPSRSCFLSSRSLAWLILSILQPPGAWAVAAAASAEPAAGRILPIEQGPAVELDAVDSLSAAGPNAVSAPTPSPTPLSAKPIVALLDLETDSIDPAQARALSQALWTHLHRAGSLRLLPRDATRNWLIRNDLYPFMPYHAGVPMGQVIRVLNADYLVTGHVERVGEAYHLDWTIFGGPAGKPLEEVANLDMATPEKMLESMSAVAAEIATMIGKTRSPASPQPVTMPVPLAPHKLPEISPMEKPPVTEAATAPKDRKPKSRMQKVEVEKPKSPTDTGKREIENPKADTDEVSALPPPPTLGATPDLTPTPTPPPALAPAHSPSPTPSPTPAATADLTPQHKADQLYREALESDLKSDVRIAKLKEAVGLAPDNPTYRQRLAADYYRRGQYAESIAQCQEALKRDPGNSILMTIKGSAHFELKQYQESRAANEAAIAADERNNWARFNLALTLTRQGSPKAASAWREYLDRATTDPSQTQQIEEARKNLAALESAEAGH